MSVVGIQVTHSVGPIDIQCKNLIYPSHCLITVLCVINSGIIWAEISLLFISLLPQISPAPCLAFNPEVSFHSKRMCHLSCPWIYTSEFGFTSSFKVTFTMASLHPLLLLGKKQKNSAATLTEVFQKNFPCEITQTQTNDFQN